MFERPVLAPEPVKPTMPTKRPAVIFDYDTKAMKYLVFENVNHVLGKWFKCTHCQKPQDSECKFHCRTLFSGEQMTGLEAT